MSYRISRDVAYGIPFRLTATVEQDDTTKNVEINMNLINEIPPTASAVNVAVRMTLPKNTVSVSCGSLGPGERYDYRQQDKTFVWHIKKVQGGATSFCKLKASNH